MINSRTIAQRAQQQKMLGIVRKAPICMVTVVDETGRLVSQPMTPQQVTDEGDVWFFLDLSSEKVRQLASRPYVNLAFGQGSTWLSASGRGHVVHDAAKVHQLWNAYADSRFPDGPADPRLGLLRVPTGAEHWDGAAALAGCDTSRSSRSVMALRRSPGARRARGEIRARAWCALRARRGRSARSCHSPGTRGRRAEG
jgi:general stress protein 26